MAGVRFTELQSRPREFLDFTSLTLDEFQQLVPPFEAAFHARMAAWRMDGKPRTARRFTVYKNCPLPTPEDRLLFILVYLKTYALQVVHGRLFGMVQGKANQWVAYSNSAVNFIAPKPGTMPSSQPMWEGATPWFHTCFTTNSLCWPSCGSSSCCLLPRLAEELRYHRQRRPSSPSAHAPTRPNPVGRPDAQTALCPV
jgi:Helix-turn-helix of DDE superfamily endonuclease